MNNPFEYALENLYGITEIKGEKDNPLIMKMYHEIGQQWVEHDEVAWCAAAHSWIHKQCGFDYTGKLNARSWENFGHELRPPIEKPYLGCTVVFWRISPTSGYGHVGFFVREDGDYIWVLGGNQSNQYNISRYKKNQVLSYREIPKKQIT